MPPLTTDRWELGKSTAVGARHVTDVQIPTQLESAGYRPESPDLPIVVTAITDQESQPWDQAERFVYRVFRDAGFCDRSDREWVEEIDSYRSTSTLQVATDRDHQIVGCVRTTLGTYDELPIGQFTPDNEVPSGLLCEIGSLAVDQSLRGLGVVNELHRAAVQGAVRSGATGFCMLVEPWSIDFFCDVYGVPLIQSAAAKEYMGSLTVPATVTFDALWPALLRLRPFVFEWVTDGFTPEERAQNQIPILLR